MDKIHNPDHHKCQLGLLQWPGTLHHWSGQHVIIRGWVVSRKLTPIQSFWFVLYLIGSNAASGILIHQRGNCLVTNCNTMTSMSKRPKQECTLQGLSLTSTLNRLPAR